MAQRIDKVEVKKKLAQALEQKLILEAQENFLVFVRLLARYMLDGNEYRHGKHIELLAAALQDVEADVTPRLMIALPPGSMKSVLAMLWVAWCMGRHPHWRIMWVSHTTDKAEECSLRVRDLVRSKEYQQIFPMVHIREDKQGVTHWKLTMGGSFYPAGAGKSIAGYRFDVGVLDDVLSEQTAKSDVERERINKWYGPGFRSRKLPRSKIVMINTRWHENDLMGYLLDLQDRQKGADQWAVISIPAILDKHAAEFLGLQEGGSYWPEFITLEDLEATRASLTTADWNSLYLQMPVPEDGALFKTEHFQDWTDKDAPICEEVIFSLDTAFSTRSTADFSVVQVWGIFHLLENDTEEWHPHCILLNVARGRWTYPELRRQVTQLYTEYRPSRLIVENKASGQSLIQDLRQSGLPVVPFLPEKDKVARAHSVTHVMDKKRVWLPHKRTFVADFLKEVMQFPRGKHDDQVDAMVMALHYFKKKYMMVDRVSVREDNGRAVLGRSYWRAVRYGDTAATGI